AGVMSEEHLPVGSGDTPAHRQLARELAEESIVLLKNDNGRLPLDVAKIKKLAVIGLNANNIISGGGSSRVDPHHWVTPLAGLQEKLGKQVQITYEPGYDNRLNPMLVEAARFTLPDGKTPGLKAEIFNNLDLSGEPVLTRVDPHIRFWWAGAGPATGVVNEKHYSIHWSGSFTAPETGETHFYLNNTGLGKVWLDGDLILECEIVATTNSSADFETQGAQAVVRLEKGKKYDFKATFVSGEDNPFALIELSYLPPLGVTGDLLSRAVKTATDSDAVVIVAGLSDAYESEGHDRPDMSLPGHQEELIRAVIAANPNAVVIVNAGSPVEMPWADEVDALILSYYPGQEGGHALADILFGDVNPSGKLTVTYPKQLKDNPAYINYPGWKDVRYGEGIFVGYRYYDAKDVEPLFPFGHGLSYTLFKYSELALPSEVEAGETFQVSVMVENEGNLPGQEIVQLYVRDVESTLVRPPKELKGFEKITLAQGEVKRVTFELGPRDLAYYHPHQKAWVTEHGTFEVQVGASSRDIRLKGKFNLINR
ncbi:MAG: glycoside hydrolase family 3 C-terminal domain-containing protein, partial [Anaerolineales bacterium]